MPLIRFPDDFVWGAAAAAYQVEGAAAEDGKGPSTWDMFCATPGKVWLGQSGSIACDHYHRYVDDVALLRRMGLGAYRLSLAWSRMIGDGNGADNPKGFEFYDRLIDELLASGITPYVTLFHWDYPLALHHKGGWLNRDSAAWFADYAERAIRKFGDRVQHWMTFNEPQVFVDAGHREGRHAPGNQLRFREVLQACHHVLLAHGLAIQAMRAARPTAKLSIAPVALPVVPPPGQAADYELLSHAMFRTAARNLRTNAWWLDPLLLGHYPADGLALFEADLPSFPDSDMAQIRQPLDFLGVNIYSAEFVRGAVGQLEFVEPPPGYPMSAFDWPLVPECMYYGTRLLYERYQIPLVITENGISCRDQVSIDGHVHDSTRIDFIDRHLLELGRAIAEGVPITGYFHWSIMDNFEWAHGYKHRFGLVHVDYQTQARTLKDSALHYRRIIESNGACLPWSSKAAFG